VSGGCRVEELTVEEVDRVAHLFYRELLGRV
jgi:hypothetical protein